MSQIVQNEITYSSGNDFVILNAKLSTGQTGLRFRSPALSPNSTVEIIASRKTSLSINTSIIQPTQMNINQTSGGSYVLDLEFNQLPYDLYVQVMLS